MRTKRQLITEEARVAIRAIMVTSAGQNGVDLDDFLDSFGEDIIDSLAVEFGAGRSPTEAQAMLRRLADRMFAAWNAGYSCCRSRVQNAM